MLLRILKEMVWKNNKWLMVANELNHRMGTTAANEKGRIGKQCREHWNEISKHHGLWTEIEDNYILEAFVVSGGKWAAMAIQMAATGLPLRSATSIKNRHKTLKNKSRAQSLAANEMLLCEVTVDPNSLSCCSQSDKDDSELESNYVHGIHSSGIICTASHDTGVQPNC